MCTCAAITVVFGVLPKSFSARRLQGSVIKTHNLFFLFFSPPLDQRTTAPLSEQWLPIVWAKYSSKAICKMLSCYPEVAAPLWMRLLGQVAPTITGNPEISSKHPLHPEHLQLTLKQKTECVSWRGTLCCVTPLCVITVITLGNRVSTLNLQHVEVEKLKGKKNGLREAH